MIYWIIFFIGQILFAVGTFMDFQSSKKQLTHGLKETNKFSRDKYGYFSSAKFWRNHLIFWGIFTGLTVLFVLISGGKEEGSAAIPAIFGGTFIIAGLLSAYTAINNNRQAEESRKNDQIPIMERLSEVTTYDREAILAAAAATGIVGTEKEGRMRFDEFQWLYMDGMTRTAENIAKFNEAALYALWQAARQPRSQWFANTAMRKLN